MTPLCRRGQQNTQCFLGAFRPCMPSPSGKVDATQPKHLRSSIGTGLPRISTGNRTPRRSNVLVKPADAFQVPSSFSRGFYPWKARTPPQDVSTLPPAGRQCPRTKHPGQGARTHVYLPGHSGTSQIPKWCRGCCGYVSTLQTCGAIVRVVGRQTPARSAMPLCYLGPIRTASAMRHRPVSV